jgi:UPF0755 protein
VTELGFHLDDESEQEVVPPPQRARLTLVLLAPVVLVLALIVVFISPPRGSSDVVDYAGAGSGDVQITVVAGDTLTAIGRTLAEADVVADHRAFVRAAVDDDRATRIGPGVYAMRLQMSGAAALERLLDPSSRIVIRIVIPEGSRAARIVAIVADAAAIDVEEVRVALQDRDSLDLPDYAPDAEGFLFPATYEFDPGTSAATILRAMVRRFEASAGRVDLVSASEQIGRTPLEIVTIASILEAEVAPGDFGKAARVIYNRLERGMKLQMDSTLNYGLGESSLMFTQDELRDDNPYNTYVIPALPPGPIGSPGEAAMRAALEPEDGTWLFFVSVNPDAKLTKFATTEAEFFRLRAEFRAWYRQNR